MPGLVRIPDVFFISWQRLPAHEVPSDPIPGLAPDLAVEVLSEGNTPGEMQRKLKDYFFAGVRLVWFVNPDARTVQVYTAPDQSTVLSEPQTLEGGLVLPGLRVPLQKLFTRTPRRANGPAREKSTEPRHTGKSGKRRKGR
jgi:Uma2 family endonuclease